jgi:acyl-CoA thioester hydrolase
MQINFSNSTNIRVRYGETDQMGYCYYGNYAQYFEVGRVEALRSIGLSYRKMEEKGVMLPVSEFNVKYFYPAFYDDELMIQTKIISLIGSRLFFEYDIVNVDKKCISKATTTLVFVSKTTMKPIKPPSEFIELISKFESKNEI